MGGQWRAGAGLPWSAAPAAPTALPTFADVVERASPGVVAVRALVSIDGTTAIDGGDGSSLGVRNGSGILVHVLGRTGLVVTARHLTVRSARILVEVPHFGRFDAALVGEDEVTDLAVLRIANAPPSLPTLELGNSEELRAGDWIVAVGNPFGFKQTVTAGVVSFVGRHLHNSDAPVSSEFLQFSAQVNPGSSGCPVLDLAGRVVGVTTQAADAAQGISFAIPSRTLKWVLEAMDRSSDGRVHRGQLGISFDTRTGVETDGRRLRGAVVYRVLDGSPAEAAGIQPGDLVLRIGDHDVRDAGDLHECITRTPPGAMVQLSIDRDGKRLEPIAVVLTDAAVPRERDSGLVR